MRCASFEPKRDYRSRLRAQVLLHYTTFRVIMDIYIQPVSFLFPQRFRLVSRPIQTAIRTPKLGILKMSNSNKLSTLIIDDEPLARARVREKLQGDDEIEVITEWPHL